MKIYLADLYHNQILGGNQISGEQDYVVPLNVASIAAFLDQRFQGRVEIRIFKDPELLIDAVGIDKPDIVGFSCYIWNINLNDAIGSYIRALCPTALIVMGGPSIRDTKEGIRDFIVSRSYLDLYITFEGEWAMGEIVEEFLRNGREGVLRGQTIANCAFIRDGNLVYGEPCADNDVDELPSPYLTGWLDSFLEQGRIPLFETNRGCPFKCTFCVWGVSALNNVRKYKLDRVYAELDYVSQKYPTMQGWIMADANFGMLKRDIEIATKIRDIKRITPALKNIVIWESKNTSARNIEIAKFLGSDVGHQLMAIQTFDAGALEAVKRTNIKFETMPDRIQELHAAGTSVGTHVLAGLPNESLAGQLETLRKCFNLGFDDIGVFSTILIPGSEMERAELREKFGLKTKFRVRQGNYGQYRGIKSIDSEEIIRSSNAITEDEMLFLRGVHWLVWYGWNHGFLKPLLKYLRQTHNLNPVDVIVDVLSGDKSLFPRLQEFLAEFYEQAGSEWFATHAEIEAHYYDEKNWNSLMENGYSKVEFVYNSRMIMDREVYQELLDYICASIKAKFADDDASAVARVLFAMRVEVDDIVQSNAKIQKSVEIRRDLACFFLDVAHGNDNDTVELVLTKFATDLRDIRVKLLEFEKLGSQILAVEKTLGSLPNAFVYEISLAKANIAFQATKQKFLERTA